MRNIRVLAAGSLRLVWPELTTAFTKHSGIAVSTHFGPAGLLRQRIEQGEACDLFASANLAHPQKLLATDRALTSGVFTHNTLCLSLTPSLARENRSWLDLLFDSRLRLATSTPRYDPSGDYTWLLFDRIEALYPGKGEALKARAMTLVGGPDSAAVPVNQLAASWLLSSGHAELFIGYQSYAARLAAEHHITTLAIPAEWQQRADYAFALCTEQARPFAEFLLSAAAQEILLAAGFSR